MNIKGHTYQITLDIERKIRDLKLALRQNEYEIAGKLIKSIKGQITELEKQFNKSMKFRQG